METATRKLRRAGVLTAFCVGVVCAIELAVGVVVLCYSNPQEAWKPPPFIESLFMGFRAAFFCVIATPIMLTLAILLKDVAFVVLTVALIVLSSLYTFMFMASLTYL